MKNKYETPQIQVVKTAAEDVLTTSPILTLDEIFYDGNDLDVVDRVTW